MWGNVHKKLLRACHDNKPDRIGRIAALLEQGADINAVEQKSDRYNGMTPLLIALYAKDETLAIYLLERGADIHRRSAENETALNYATRSKMTRVIELLLAKGADVDEAGRWGRTPLVNAASQSEIEMVRFLIEHKADINRKGDYGYTVLHWAVGYGNLDVIGLLLEKGADINAVSNDGTTPLMRAISQNNTYELVRFLLEKKADTTPRNDSGATAYEMAKRQNNQKVLSLFAEHQQNGSDSIKWEKVSNTAVKRNSIIDEQFSQLEHLDFQTRMYVTIIKDSSGKFSHASQPFNSVARATVEDAADFLRRNGGAPDAGKNSPAKNNQRKPGKLDL